jgi:hypothetical protein
MYWMDTCASPKLEAARDMHWFGVPACLNESTLSNPRTHYTSPTPTNNVQKGVVHVQSVQNTCEQGSSPLQHTI